MQSQDIQDKMVHLRVSMEKSADALEIALMVSCLNLLFPINTLSKAFFLNMTGRYSHSFYDITFYVDLTLFVLTIIWMNDVIRFKVPIEGNRYL